jgi:hypothetical protein
MPGSGETRSPSLGIIFKFIFLIAALLLAITEHAATQTDNSWDGVWRGRWGGGAATSVTIKDGRVVEYYFRDRPHTITDSSTAGETITFSIPIFRYTLTRTNASSATIVAKGLKGDSTSGTLTKTDDSWNGTWSGNWVNRDGTASASVTITDGRVTEYLFNRVPQTFERQEVSQGGVSFGSSFYNVKISRTGPNTAKADYANTKGVTSAATLSKGGASLETDKAAATQQPKSKDQPKSAPASAAWCESDCRDLCAKTGANVASCAAQYSCSKYPAAPCAGAAAVNARAAQIRGGSTSGSSKWYYEDCAKRCDASSASPIEQNSCYAQICSQYPKRGR